MPSFSSMPVFSTEGVVDSCRVSIFCSLAKSRRALPRRSARESQRLLEGQKRHLPARPTQAPHRPPPPPETPPPHTYLLGALELLNTKRRHGVLLGAIKND